MTGALPTCNRVARVLAAVVGLLVAPAVGMTQGLGSLRAPASRDASADEWQPLEIEIVEVDVNVAGRFARTEVKQVFRNNQSWQTEGIYRFELPAGAAIVRLAMDVEGKMMEGELVERTKGRKIYENIVSKQRDPALLEHRGGNRYEMSIFPIPAQGTKTVVLVYEELAAERDNGRVSYRYDLPRIRGTRGPVIGRFRFELSADGVVRKQLARKRYRPNGPIDVTWTRRRGAGPQIYYARRGDETMFYADLTTQFSPTITGWRDVVVALDTSSSVGDRELERALDITRDLLQRLPAGVRIRIVHGDIAAGACSEKATPPSRATLRACLRRISSRGATDLSALLERAVAEAGALGRPATILLISDGLVSIGELDEARIRQVVAAKLASSGVTLHTVAVGTGRNEELLSSLAQLGRGLHHRRGTAARILSGMRGAMLADVTVAVTAGKVGSLTPRLPVSVASGEPLVVMGVLASPSARLEVRARQGAARFVSAVDLASPAAGTALTPPVVSFWARSVMADMQEAQAAQDDIVKFSLRYGVMSPFTALLVLEKDADYKRWGITRRMGHLNADSLGTIEGREASSIVKPGAAAIRPRRARPPQIRIGHAVATGDLDKNLIRGPVRSQLPRIRACYNRELRHDPQLKGTVVAQWVILPSGELESVKSSGVSPELAECVREALSRMRFPAPKDGGVVVVRYPFVFHPPVSVPTETSHNTTRVAALEKRGSALSIAQQGELLGLYLLAGNTAKAEAYYRAQRKLLAPDGVPTRQLLWLLSSALARAQFGADFRAAATARISTGHAPVELLDNLFESYLADEPTKIPIVFGGHRVPEGMAGSWLGQLFHRGHGKLALSLYLRWRRGKLYSLVQLHEMLSSSHVRGPMRARRFEIAAELIAAGEATDRQIGDYVADGVQLRRVGVVTTRLLALCKSTEDLDGPCAEWLRASSGDRRATARLRGLYLRRLADARREQQNDPESRDWWGAEAEALFGLGRVAEGIRALSDVVESEPRDPAARQYFGEALLDNGHTKLGCRALADAVRLDPENADDYYDERCKTP